MKTNHFADIDFQILSLKKYWHDMNLYIKNELELLTKNQPDENSNVLSKVDMDWLDFLKQVHKALRTINQLECLIPIEGGEEYGRVKSENFPCSKSYFYKNFFYLKRPLKLAIGLCSVLADNNDRVALLLDRLLLLERNRNPLNYQIQQRFENNLKSQIEKS